MTSHSSSSSNNNNFNKYHGGGSSSSSGKPPPAPRSLGSLTSNWFGSSSSSGNNRPAVTDTETTTTTVITNTHSGSSGSSSSARQDSYQQRRSLSVPVLPELMQERTREASSSSSLLSKDTTTHTKTVTTTSSSSTSSNTYPTTNNVHSRITGGTTTTTTTSTSPGVVVAAAVLRSPQELGIPIQTAAAAAVVNPDDPHQGERRRRNATTAAIGSSSSSRSGVAGSLSSSLSKNNKPNAMLSPMMNDDDQLQQQQQQYDNDSNNNNKSNSKRIASSLWDSQQQYYSLHPSLHPSPQQQHEEYDEKSQRHDDDETTTTFTNTTTTQTVQMTTFCYRGMEVMIVSSSSSAAALLLSTTSIQQQQQQQHRKSPPELPPPPIAYIICPRTHFVYQTLLLFDNDDNDDDYSTSNNDDAINNDSKENQSSSTMNKNKNSTTTTTIILSIQSHPMSGQICIALSNGQVYTYLPNPNDSKYHLHGRYHWRKHQMIHFHQYFTSYIPPPIKTTRNTTATTNTTKNNNNNNNSYCETNNNDDDTRYNNYYHADSFDMSLSMNYMVLIAYQNQLAVFDTTPPTISSSSTTTTSPTATTDTTTRTTTTTTTNVGTAGGCVAAELIWMTQVSNPIRTAKISGDSYAIAVVVFERQRRRHQQQQTLDDDKGDGHDLDDDDDDDDDDAATDGIHTFEREHLPHNNNKERNHTSSSSSNITSNNNKNIGVYYKPGPFLVHSAPVSFISFRGYGNVTSSTTSTSHVDTTCNNSNNNNDLLLSYCSKDHTARLYGQNAWNPLTEWITTSMKQDTTTNVYYDTYIDFIDCTSALTMGDIIIPPSIPSATTKDKNKLSIRQGRLQSSIYDAHSNDIDTTKQQQQQATSSSRIQFPTIPNHFPIPTTHAGAWIYELMIPSYKSYDDKKKRRKRDEKMNRNKSVDDDDGVDVSLLPFIRISRLTYLERGIDDLNPTILECISSYLPPSSCFYVPKNEPSTTRQQHDNNQNRHKKFSVQGIWPTWNPFLMTPPESFDPNEYRTPRTMSMTANSTAIENGNTSMSGSPMSFLGFVSGPMAGPPSNHHSGGSRNDTGAYNFGAHGSLGGTQCPPCEIRIVAAHDGIPGYISLFDYSIHGDKALTQVSLGNPIRHILSISDMNERIHSSLLLSKCHRKVVVDRTSHDTGISNYHRPKAVKASITYNTTSRLIANVCPNSQAVSITLQKSGTMSFMPTNWLPDDVDPVRAASIFRHSSKYVLDKSLIPAPEVLTSVQLPGTITTNVANDDNVRICVLLWWEDYRHSGSPILVAILSSGTIVLFEIPPPHRTTDLKNPDYGIPLVSTVTNELQGLVPSESYDNSISSADNDDDGGESSSEFEVAVIPDPEFGLGLRLEAPPDGIGAFVGSFKRHPLLGDALPAEKSGRIEIGDDLLSANGIHLEKKAFDDIVAAVREVGSSCGPGNPIRMRFRRSIIPKSKMQSVLSVASTRKANDANSMERRSMEQMLGVNPVTMKRRLKASKQAQELDSTSDKRSMEIKLMNTDGILGIFPSILACIDMNLLDKEIQSKYKIISLDRHTVGAGCRAALMIWSIEHSINVTLLYVPIDRTNEKSDAIKLGSLPLTSTSGSLSDASICDIDVVERGSSFYTIVGWSHSGELHLIKMIFDASCSDIRESKINLHSFPMFNMQCTWTSGSILKVYSSTLLATMQPSSTDSTLNDVIRIWSMSPQPGTKIDSGLTSDDNNIFDRNYYSSNVSTGYCLERESFLNFEFFCVETLDSLPSLVAFSFKHLTLFHKEEGSIDWIPRARISYDTNMIDNWINVDNDVSKSTFFCANPEDAFPHLLQGLHTLYSSQNVLKPLRSDWHPLSLLSIICCSLRGPKIALLSHVRPIMLWLCSHERTYSGSFPVVPFMLHGIPLKDDNLHKPQDLMSILSTKTENPEDESIRKFMDALSMFIETKNSTTISSKNQDISETVSSSISQILLTMSTDNLRSLCVLAGMVLDINEYDGLDVNAQLQLFTIKYFDRWNDLMKKVPPQTTGKRLMPAHGVLVRGSSSVKDTVEVESVASAGVIAALLSSDQELLMRAVRATTQRITWNFVRERRIPYWERSDKVLAALAEEIGSAMFLETRDSMESSLFYIISKKMTTLQNLAKSDQSQTGRTFSKFLNDYDFTSERGRRAAEKNAFSLLRKCRYQVAAAFFLLASPPFLNAALETIVTKMHDIDLAFFVARLTESAGQTQGWPQAIGFGSVLGGGGGYAGGGDFSETKKTHFCDWQPRLGSETRRLLVERVLVSVCGDSTMTALCLLWLNKKQEASWFLSRIAEVRYAGLISYNIQNDASQSFLESLNRRFKTPSVSWTNAVVDFSSAPFLLKSLGASSRAILASSLVVSKALCSVGCELSSIRICSDISDHVDLENTKHDGATSSSETVDINNSKYAKPPSSIFDEFNVAPQDPMINDHKSASPLPLSSIFDVYTAPPLQSINPKSIFDDFDVQPPPKITTTLANNADPLRSSIFDDFNGPSSSSKFVVTSSTSSVDTSMKSSIFDNFDPAPQTARSSFQQSLPGDCATSGMSMQSSIFDSYSVAPAQPSMTKKDAAIASDPMQSSIFDDFTVPHAVHKSSVPTNKPPENHSTFAKKVKGEVSAPEIQFCLHISKLPTPKLWFEWRHGIIMECVSRRLLREVSAVVEQFFGDLPRQSVSDFYQKVNCAGTSDILIVNCDLESVLGGVRQSLDGLLSLSNLEPMVVVEHAYELLGSSHHQSLLLLVILYSAIRRDDLAEETLKSAISKLMQCCINSSILHDDVALKLHTVGYSSNLFTRLEAARLGWELESCLWLHRGGGLQLSHETVKECIVSVRLGLLVASWKRDYDCIEAMILNEPDCMVDSKSGQQVWASLKEIDPSTSGIEAMELGDGWEFLVECKRSQATELLRDASPGCFLIRPHPQDDSIFTLSFKTNLEAAEPDTSESTTRDEEIFTPDTSADEMSDIDIVDKPRRSKKKKIKKEDVVQHAIIRVSESGFRCGSFGPFTSLMALLEMVSSSLPFQLRFDLPPKHGIVREPKRLQTSPNAIFLRKLTLHNTLTPFGDSAIESTASTVSKERMLSNPPYDGEDPVFIGQLSVFGKFSQIIVLSLLRRQRSSIAAFDVDNVTTFAPKDGVVNFGPVDRMKVSNNDDNVVSAAARFLRPLLTWCRTYELMGAYDLAPDSFRDTNPYDQEPPVSSLSERSEKVIEESLDVIEVSPLDQGLFIEGGDSILRSMIRQGSGIEFSTLRLLDSGECTMLVLFSREEAMRWLIASGIDETDENASYRLDMMEKLRYIESVKIPSKLKSIEPNSDDVRYRFVDPWEVEALGTGSNGESRSASLGRERYVSFNLEQVYTSTEAAVRELGDNKLLELWAMARGDVLLTKAIAAFHPPWEKCCIGDLQLTNGKVTEPPPFVNSIRRHLYRDALYRRLNLPQRFMAFVQVELLDLKNLTSPNGSLSLTAYALLRLKRPGSSGTLTNKARTIDSASTIPIKLNKTSGPNAPASWGSTVRFRFPLPNEEAARESDGSNNKQHTTTSSNRETLFKGPPRVLQISVYEKKLLTDHALGSADVSIDGLSAGGQIEEWVPLRNEKHGGTITWFTRIRVSLRFDLMNIAPDHLLESQIPVSVGLQRIYELTHNKSSSAVHEDIHQRSMSVTDFNDMV